MVRKTVKQVIKACDLFAQPVAFRYADQPEYESLTGGIVSIGLFILFAVIFTNTIIQTLNKMEISAKITSIQEEDPSQYGVGTDTFMFAVGITGLDLNQGQRWFEVYMEQRTTISGVKKKTVINLQKCRKSQWTRIKSQMSDIYDRIDLDKWLCPPDNLTITLQGKYSSDIFRFYKFGVKKCNETSPESATRPCVDNTAIQTFLNASETFTFNFYYINTIINPKSKVYLSNYLDDLNYFPFTPTDGVEANFFLSSYQIITDESIYPYEQKRYESGGISTTTSQTINYKVRQKDYLKFYIRKSSLSISIERSFLKVDETLSYIGGLFSAIITVLAIMGKYNQISYEMEIAKNLYHYDRNVPLKSDQFNFFVFLGYLIYAFFQTICIKLPWKRMQVYFRSLEQVRKQMDIRLVMKKVLYSQRMAIAALDESKAKILHLQEPLTLQQAEEIRKDHRFYDKLQSKYFDYQKIRQQSQLEQRQLELEFQNRNQSSKKSLESSQKKNSRIISHDQILLQSISQEDSRKKRKLQKMSTKKLLKQTYKNTQIRQKEKRVNKNAKGILNLFMDQDQKKQEELNCMIDLMKQHVKILQQQANQGDIISERILERFDPKLMKMFLLNDVRRLQQPSINATPMKNQQNMNLSHFTINLGQGTSNNITINKNLPQHFR